MEEITNQTLPIISEHQYSNEVPLLDEDIRDIKVKLKILMTRSREVIANTDPDQSLKFVGEVGKFAASTLDEDQGAGPGEPLTCMRWKDEPTAWLRNLANSIHANEPVCPGGEQEDSEWEDHGSVVSEQNQEDTSVYSDEEEQTNDLDKKMLDEEIKVIWIHHHHMDGGWYKIDSVLWELIERQYNHHPSIFNDYFAAWWIDRWEHLDSATCKANLWPIFAVSSRVDSNHEVRQVLADCKNNLGIAQARQLFRDGKTIMGMKIIENLDHAVLSITHLNSIVGAMQTAIADGIKHSRDIMTYIEQLVLNNQTTNAHMTGQMMNMTSMLHEINTHKQTMEAYPREGSLNLRMEASGIHQFDLESMTASSYLPNSHGLGAFGPKILTKGKKLEETQTRAKIQEGSKSIVDQRATGLQFAPTIRNKGQMADFRKHDPGTQNQNYEPPSCGNSRIIPRRPQSHMLPKGRGISEVAYKPFPKEYRRRVLSMTDDVGNFSKSFLEIVRGAGKIALAEKPSRKVSFSGTDDCVKAASKKVQVGGGEELMSATGYQYDHVFLPADKPEQPIPNPAARHHIKPCNIGILLSSKGIAQINME